MCGAAKLAHSITSSARARSMGGMLKPSARGMFTGAVLFGPFRNLEQIPVEFTYNLRA